MLTNNEIINYIYHGREERNLEFKEDGRWDDERFRSKLIKTMLAMSNLQYGGIIIIGVKENDETFTPIGISEVNAETFKQDDISTLVNEFADPFLEVNVSRVTDDEKLFIIFQITEFESIPTICKRDGQNGLRRGALYIRPRRRNETVEVPSQVEMREILDIATDKQLTIFRRRILDFQEGQEETVPDDELYDQQLDGLI